MSYRTYIVEGDNLRAALPANWVRIGGADVAGYAAGWLDWNTGQDHNCVGDLGHEHHSRREAERCLKALTAQWAADGIEAERE